MPRSTRDSLAPLQNSLLDEPGTERALLEVGYNKNTAGGELLQAVAATVKHFALAALMFGGHVLALPFIGSIYMYGGYAFIRPQQGMTPDDDHDWQTITIVGGVMQVAAIFPLYCALQYDRFMVKPGDPPVPDYWGSIALYCVTGFVLERVAYGFYWKVRARKRELSRLEKSTRRSTALVRTRREMVERTIKHLRRDAQLNTWWMLLAVVIISVVELGCIRGFANQLDANRKFIDKQEFFILASIFWILLFIVVNTVVVLGLTALVFQLRLIEQFAVQRTERDLTDIRDPQLVVTWCEIWQGIILREVQTNPVSRSLTFWGSVYSLFLVMLCVWYLIMTYIYQNIFSAELRDFRAGASFVLVYSSLATIGYVAATVQMQRSIEAQHRNVATVYHKLRVRIDDVRAGRIHREPEDLELLQGKARVVHSLDRLLITADPRARVFNSSLESLRWAAVNVGLAFVNAYLGLILYTKCLAKTGSGAH